MATEINLDRCGPFQLPHINHRKNVNVCITLPGKGVRLFWQVFTRHSLVQLKKNTSGKIVKQILTLLFYLLILFKRSETKNIKLKDDVEC